MEAIRRVAPAVFAKERHSSKSPRFTAIPTVSMIEGLANAGFGIVAASQTHARDVGKMGHTKHMLRFRRHGDQAVAKVGDVFPEVVLVNANDGASSYTLSAGLFRLVCLNGMTVSERFYRAIRVPHVGDAVSKVIEGSYEIIEESVRAIERVQEWQGVILSERQQIAFAEKARRMRFGINEDGSVRSPITAQQLLLPRRVADNGDDLWHVFSRVQEAVIKGGLSADYPGSNRRSHMREIVSIAFDQALNKDLWELADEAAGRATRSKR